MELAEVHAGQIFDNFLEDKIIREYFESKFLLCFG